MMKFTIINVSVSILAVAKVVIAATPAEWRSQSIYFLLTDRFARTDGSTTAPCNPEDRVSYLLFLPRKLTMPYLE